MGREPPMGEKNWAGTDTASIPALGIRGTAFDAPGATPDSGWEGNVRAVKWRNEEGSVHDGCKGHYVHDSCVYGPGDLPWIVRSPSLFAYAFDSTDPLVVTCLERWHRLRVLRGAEAAVEPHWHFPRERHLNGRLGR
ncbi:beta-1,3-galactosyl-O-glycosyl-glycoprotein beta-1,6-N-acetylglucosaminyltransferase 7 isoform X2 [Vulpes vulpes]|uniref:Beta-1,3-galactosyl-O-glycosyl-glycoprotein beta-1,6-N-acetylglucosaminyltransferase 7 isoform X2 n=1 Tax=Vulpes vulpes TaxID=9627 RepID=A0A3Q7UC91_VULVU|nr:beta-1,3-galactosyl-O-glycosyl-glycoprotein beta-1,6-N-acetylglucosaminyltransferase 7 isoform X2 [Vulpes vulpes]